MDLEEQYDKIYRYCYFRIYDRTLAEDITQETFLRYFKQGLSLDSNQELPYLYTIAKNLCIDAFRQRPLESTGEVPAEQAYDPTKEWIDSITLRTVMEKLPREEQEMLFLRYVNEVSITSISAIVGLSRFSVYRRLSKSLKWLKEELTKEGFFS